MHLYLVFKSFVFTNNATENNLVQMSFYKCTNNFIGHIPRVGRQPQGICTFVVWMDNAKLLFNGINLHSGQQCLRGPTLPTRDMIQEIVSQCSLNVKFLVIGTSFLIFKSHVFVNTPY